MRIHPLSSGLGFTFLLEDTHGLFLIDAGSPGQQARVLAKMKALGRTDLKLIWITHAHYDHYGSAAALRELTGAPIGVHAADADYLSAGGSPLGTPHDLGFVFTLGLPLVNRVWPLPVTPPDFTLQDGDTLERFGLNASILHTPGHTPGHTCLLLPDRIAISGDLFGRNPRPRLQYLVATDWSQLPHSLARFQAARPEWTYTGHSPRPIPGKVLQKISSQKQTGSAEV
jgi:glyoxylase-like metal-dependent hydrolase (beta-lactamase superfamily II)